MATITLTDDGDETVFVLIDGQQVFDLNHDDDGWAGMRRGIELIKIIAQSVSGIQVVEQQDVV